MVAGRDRRGDQFVGQLDGRREGRLAGKVGPIRGLLDLAGRKLLLQPRPQGLQPPRGCVVLDLDATLAATPMSRLGTAEEIASAVLWLCSPAACYVTGVALPVDGGYTAQ